MAMDIVTFTGVVFMAYISEMLTMDMFATTNAQIISIQKPYTCKYQDDKHLFIKNELL